MKQNPRLWAHFVQSFPEIVATKNVYRSIANLINLSLDVTSADSPNILLYSAVGFPLNLLWNYVATLKFGKHRNKECISSKQITYQENSHFFDIDFAHPLNSKNMESIHDLIHDIISTTCIVATRHVIVCRNIDRINDIYSFRVLLERYSKNALFICMTHSFSSIESPLRSRFFSVRVPLFTKEDIQSIMIGLDPCLNTVQFDTRNIFKAIAIADVDRNVLATISKINCQCIHDSFNKKQTILQTRELANKVCTMNVAFRLVVEDILHFIPERKKADFVMKAAAIEHMMKQTNEGRKPLYYENLFNTALSL